MSTWTKEGSLANLIKLENGYLTRDVAYQIRGGFISSIKINVIPSGRVIFTVGIDYMKAPREDYLKLHKLNQAIFAAHRYTFTLNSDSFSNFNSAALDEAEDIKGFLEIVREQDPNIDADLFHDLLAETSLRKSIREEVMSLASKGEINEAITLAGQVQVYNFCYHDEDLIWELACSLENRMMNDESRVTAQQVYNAFEAVSASNSHFKDAQRKLLDLLYTQVPSSIEDKIHLQEERLKFALLIGNQDLVDHIYDELCGRSGLTPAINNVKLDHEFLLVVAGQLRNLYKENEELKSYKAKAEAGKAAVQRFGMWSNAPLKEEPTASVNRLNINS